MHPPPQKKNKKNKYIFIPSHLNGQDVKQVDAEAVQSVGINCRFDKRWCRGDDCDHHDKSGKSGPMEGQGEGQEGADWK